MARRRNVQGLKEGRSEKAEKGAPELHELHKDKKMSQHSKWLMLALASGAFAAMNGLFAKLTTTELTTSISRAISHIFSSSNETTTLDVIVEYLVRAAFFGLNLFSNFIMWTLFTRALTASPSTTKVTITNTTANFLVTGVLGMLVFREKVNAQWLIGATLMAAGCIIVGMREKQKEESPRTSAGVNEGEDIGLAGNRKLDEDDDLIALEQD
ncbi:TPA_exp: Uncharacterized protein A8136_4832 [Trichophyton benhamiae CBS 112371]|uniref:EamA domain-containing protein n=1 Tax=Arthroderma benhamiae (strain ATCC MYA-4681 / CBS 112371) TaxID=663331 RepID=D4B3F0_ARTBC|nr:uncharacterized protein ARB_02987 [Trichophyton benhamiae CBS 112371]EFE29648.1 hypothetical protein ARB_02987 [Trichophyton benhamiae CBS 112371]DAA72907.1 TPA_exp: Uncharacterized protein A8136_4832 [Trichophyton benhamiae CBS 112371]